MGKENTFDYIIVGAGAAGCVIANRLTDNSDCKVLILEAGELDTPKEFHEPRDVIKTWAPQYDWGYVSEPVPALKGRKINVIRGKVAGGSTSVHALLHVRGCSKDFDHWNYLGNEGWSYKDVLPYFIKSEDFEGGANKYHGAGGLLSVRTHPSPTTVATAFTKAAMELGYDGPNWDYNGERQENGAFLYQVVLTKDGKRASSAQAFLAPALKRPNLTFSGNSRATRLIVEKGRITGIEYLKDGKPAKASSAHEVIVAGGAFESPRLLMHSGIGPAAHLKSHGISVVSDLPGVGKNLQDHVLLMVQYKSKKELPPPLFLAEAGLFVHTRPGTDAASPDLQFNFNAGVPEFAAPGMGPWFGFVSVLVQPQSRGSVSLRSAKPEDLPMVQLNYMACESDIQVLMQGVEITKKLADTKALSEFSAGPVVPAVNGSKQEIRDFVLNNCSTIWHPVGTCKMGRDQKAVVDPQLKVYGIEGLRVADASIMPVITAGNPAAATMMIGEKAADMIRKA